jgi:hypothetical protein
MFGLDAKSTEKKKLTNHNEQKRKDSGRSPTLKDDQE